jgi:NAD(P)-dependent dehydrogenase (short-subunit alcohol dehydrogenase family)
MDGDLGGRTILVTGGGSGLGAALCETLAASGADVAVSDIKLEAARAVAERIRARGARCIDIRLDVASEADVDSAFEQVIGAFGRLDVLINNAGTDVTRPIEELAARDWDRVLSTNLRGPFLTSRRAARQMKVQGGGHIVNIASTAAKRTWPNASAYHASKWGLLGLSHALHAELRPANIKVSAIIAGGMRTPFLLDRFPDIDLANLQDPANVARTVKWVLLLPPETVIPEVMVLPMRETSWP